MKSVPIIVHPLYLQKWSYDISDSQIVVLSKRKDIFDKLSKHIIFPWEIVSPNGFLHAVELASGVLKYES